MIIEKAKFNQESVESTGVAKSGNFGFSKNANEMIFTMFTKNIYSNPIGSVVREITSNCFDAHVAAKTQDAVVIRLTTEDNQKFINFIDVGTGMSPDIITNVYGVYFESTKDQSNDEIGGFGIGGKTPLAYGDSFYLITISNGIKYTYLIYKGTASPMYDLLAEEATDDGNGTTIKIAISDGDVYTFQKEIIKQLYYFENIIFEGFNSEIANDYQIFVGENFLFRGHQCNNYAHVCLGRVAYPIDYGALDIMADEYRLPIALRFNIGDLNVTASRENLDYSKETKALIITKLKLAKAELIGMLQNEIKKIKNLDEYLVLRSNFGNVTFDKSKDIKISLSQYVTKKDLKFSKYSSIVIPEQTSLSQLCFTHKECGKHKVGRYSTNWSGDVSNAGSRGNIYLFASGGKKKKRTQSYLRSIHETYYLLTPSSIGADMPDSKSESFQGMFNPDRSAGVLLSKIQMNEVIMLLEEFQNMYVSKFVKYEDIAIPADYTMGKKLDANFLKREISYRSVSMDRGTDYRDNMHLQELASFKGTIIYGEHDNIDSLLAAARDLSTLGYAQKNFKIIGLSKANIEYMKHFKHAIHFSEVFKRFILKKRNDIIKFQCAEKFIEKYDGLSGLLKTTTFRKYDKNLNMHFNILEKEYFKMKKLASKHINVSNEELKIKKSDIKINCTLSFDFIAKQSEKNPLVKYLSLSSYSDETKNPEVLKLISLVYVK